MFNVGISFAFFHLLFILWTKTKIHNWPSETKLPIPFSLFICFSVYWFYFILFYFEAAAAAALLFNWNVEIFVECWQLTERGAHWRFVYLEQIPINSPAKKLSYTLHWSVYKVKKPSIFFLINFYIQTQNPHTTDCCRQQLSKNIFGRR